MIEFVTKSLFHGEKVGQMKLTSVASVFFSTLFNSNGRLYIFTFYWFFLIMGRTQSKQLVMRANTDGVLMSMRETERSQRHAARCKSIYILCSFYFLAESILEIWEINEVIQLYWLTSIWRDLDLVKNYTALTI